MRLLTLITLFLPTLASSARLSILIPASQHVPNPAALAPSTSATLTTLSHTYVAPLSTANSFFFRNISAGSYLLSISCTTHEFAPLRIDVAESGTVEAWGTFRGNEWDNKGEMMAVGGGNTVEVRATGVKEYYMQRGGFSLLSMLKNPMILIGLFSLVLVFGMPYLMDNMDPEMRAEFEASQKAGGLTGALTGKSGTDANSVANFDAAAWLAGKSKK